MSRRGERFGRWIVAVVLFVGLGCGGQKTYPVRGKVVYPDGTPLPGGLISFEPLDPNAGHIGARGIIQEDGTFRLGTFQDQDGAVEGEHRVLVLPPAMSEEDVAKGAKPWIDRKYRSYDTSGLKFHVKREANDFTITVTKPAS